MRRLREDLPPPGDRGGMTPGRVSAARRAPLSGPAAALSAALFAAGVCRAADGVWSGVVPLSADGGRTSSGEGRTSCVLEFLGALDLPDDAPEGLSGVAWLGADDPPPDGVRPSGVIRGGSGDASPVGAFAFAEDSGGRVHFAGLGFDAATGVPASCVFSAVRTVPGAVDLEGVAFDPASGSLWLSDECGPALFRLSLREGTDPAPERRADLLPPSLRRCRPNRSLEALGFDPVSRTLYTASETAVEGDPDGVSRLVALLLPPEGKSVPRSEGKSVPRVREWLVPLEPATGAALPMLPDPFTGLCGLAPLPDGRLLALERTFGYEFASGPDGEPVQSLCRFSISLLDPNGGTDPGGPPLDPSGRTDPGGPPVLEKRVLWRALAGNANYEGICLGPALPDGGRLVVLVSDGDVSRRRGLEMRWRKSLLFFRLCQSPSF